MNNCGSCWHFLEEECTNESVRNGSDDAHLVDPRASDCKLYKHWPLVDKCIENVVEWCRINEQYVRNQFDPPLTDKQFEYALDANSWVAMERMFRGKKLHMTFDNEELDSQLRGYTVIADMKVSTHVQGE